MNTSSVESGTRIDPSMIKEKQRREKPDDEVGVAMYQKRERHVAFVPEKKLETFAAEAKKRLIERMKAGLSLKDISQTLAGEIKKSFDLKDSLSAEILEQDLQFLNHVLARKTVIEYAPSDLLSHLSKHQKQYAEMETGMAEMKDDVEAQRYHQIYMDRVKQEIDLLTTMKKNPGARERLRKEDTVFWDEVMRATGGAHAGATKEIKTKEIKEIRVAQAIKESVKKANPLLEELRRLQSERHETQKRFDALSFWFWKDRIAKRATRERLDQLKQRISAVTRQLKGREVAQPPKLSDEYVRPLGSAQELYQAEKESLYSLRHQRRELGFFAWSEKRRLDEAMRRTESRLKELAVEMRGERSLE